MRLLVLGGTAWLGGYVAAAGVARGDDVTCLARGTGDPVPAGATFVRGDRDRPDAYDGLAGDWDVVVDVSRLPGHVSGAAAALSGRVGTYVFTSSASAYADHGAPGADETAAVLPPLEEDVAADDVMADPETYGRAKVTCERAVVRAFDRSLVVRVGLIGGPGDVSDRTGYWPWRFARPSTSDGSVLVPAAPDAATQVIDVRDLADWLVTAPGAGVDGTFNAMGETVPFRRHLEIAREVAGHTGPVVAADGEWLTAQGVQPWAGPRSLPLWLDGPAWAGFSRRLSSAARAAGLVTRPLAETLTDTLAWELARTPGPRLAGLSDEDERALLHAWAESG